MKVLVALIKLDHTWNGIITMVDDRIIEIDAIFNQAKQQVLLNWMSDPKDFPNDIIGVHPIKIEK